MGFGHRVYKNGGSRVPTVREALIRVAAAGGTQKWLDIYDVLEKWRRPTASNRTWISRPRRPIT